MKDTELVSDMMRCTGKFFFGMKPNHGPLKSMMHGEMFILDYLERKNCPVMPGELSTKMLSSTARVAIALRNLEKNGCIKREADKNDRRKVLVTITACGSELVTREHEEIAKKISRIIDAIGESDAREYIRIVRRIVEINKEINIYESRSELNG